MTSLTNSTSPSPCSLTEDSIALFYTTFFSPSDFLLQYNKDAVVTINRHNTCLSSFVEDHVNYIKDQQLQEQKKDYYTYSIELDTSSKKGASIIPKIQTATKKAFSSNSQLLSTPITLQQIYFIDSNNCTFHTGLLELLHTKNIELNTVKQFPLNGQLKRKIREFTSGNERGSEKTAVDIQKRVLEQQNFLEESRNRVFGKTSQEKKKTEVPSFWLLKPSSKEQVQLSVLHWLDHFLQTYKEHPEHSIKMLLDNRKILLSQICNHIEEGICREYCYSEYIPSTLASLDLLFAILQKLYVEKAITKENLLEFLLPIGKEATPTCFILEHYYYLPLGHSYVYLFSQILTERSLHSEVFLRMKKCIYCKHSSNAATFLLRLRKGIKFAKLDWKFRDDTRGVSNLYPLLQALDACRRNDSLSLQQRIAIIFSSYKIPLYKVLQAFYRLENRMKRKDWFPLESKEERVSLQQLEKRLQFHKEIYPKQLEECQNKNKEAQERRIRQKEKEIADLQKLIDQAENWKPEDDFNPVVLFTVGFCTLFRGEDIKSIKRKAYSARQDALREWEAWERNQRARSYQAPNPLGLLGLFVPSGSVTAPSKEKTSANPTSSHATNVSRVSSFLKLPSLDGISNNTPCSLTPSSFNPSPITPSSLSVKDWLSRMPSLENISIDNSYLNFERELQERLNKLRS